MEIIKLNLIPSGNNPVCHCSQYDNGRIIRAELFDGLTPYSIASGDSLTLNVRKPDNTIVSANLTTTQGNTYVDFATTEQICAVVGKSLAEIKITNGTTVIGTLNFIIEVERDVLADGIPSESVIDDLEELIAEAIGDDYYNKTEIDAALALKADKTELYNILPTEQASGAIVSFSDGADNIPVKSLIASIQAIQEGSGEPSTSNVRNIVGFTGANIKVVGANLFDEVMEVGSINNSTGANEPASNVMRSTNYTQITPNTTYKITQGSYVYAFFYYDASKTFISYANGSSTFTTPANACYVRFRLYSAYGTTYNNDIAILYPSSLNSYVAYNANSTTTPITWQSEAGTVYGGSLDVTSGKLTVTWHAIDLGSLTWNYDAESVPSKPYFFCQRDTVKVSTQNLLCSIYQLANVGVSNMPNYSMKSNNKGQVLIVNSDYSDKDTFKTAMSGVYLVCEKLTPETYQLDPVTVKSILGDNNIFADTGDVDVTIRADIALYIQNRLSS